MIKNKTKIISHYLLSTRLPQQCFSNLAAFASSGLLFYIFFCKKHLNIDICSVKDGVICSQRSYLYFNSTIQRFLHHFLTIFCLSWTFACMFYFYSKQQYWLNSPAFFFISKEHSLSPEQNCFAQIRTRLRLSSVWWRAMHSHRKRNHCVSLIEHCSKLVYCLLAFCDPVQNWALTTQCCIEPRASLELSSH